MNLLVLKSLNMTSILIFDEAYLRNLRNTFKILMYDLIVKFLLIDTF